MHAEIATFQINDGFPEALVRSLLKGFLKDDQYAQLKNCSNMNEFKLVLEDTDYGPYITAEPSPIELSVLSRKMQEKLMEEITFIKGQAYEPLSSFLNMMLHSYQLDNIINVIEGVKNEVPLEHLMKGLDPLGYFPELKNIRTVEGDDYATLYQ
jgi:V-type H+-transporting ATPase subunit d